MRPTLGLPLHQLCLLAIDAVNLHRTHALGRLAHHDRITSLQGSLLRANGNKKGILQAENPQRS